MIYPNVVLFVLILLYVREDVELKKLAIICYFVVICLELFGLGHQINCRVDRSDPDAAVAPRRYELDPLLPLGEP
ncbi:hypothetical protein TSUD_283460 [Trifolium subterraneum]|uniref:Uncharacterized protein n=1 Tax=Trifolium subterraneum TaxID=3900 RepID=A0A2Z6NLQ6_TRISU|nr:hypothetical protein TSUD_283460 [Trifolium subterraneum]